MKLVFVTDNGFSEKNGEYFYNGANVQHYATVTKHFEEITFIARNNNFEKSSNMISNEHQVYLVNSITNGNIFRNYKKLNNILEEAIKNSDVVMCFGINGYLAYKKAKKYNKPTIVYIGGCVYDSLRSMGSYKKRYAAPILRAMIKEMAENAAFVHYVDQYLVERYPTKGEYLICPSAKISIDENVMFSRENKISQKTNLVSIGLIGYTHNRIKGIDTAIRALRLLGKEYKLQVVGRGNHSWLVNLAQKLNVEDQVEFLGVLSDRAEVFQWLDSIDIYIQPSLTEGMPRSTIEAMSRGCPVVSSNVGGLVNIVDEDFRINRGDYNALSDTIKNFVQNKALMRKAAFDNYQRSKRFDSNMLDIMRDEFYKKVSSTKN